MSIDAPGFRPGARIGSDQILLCKTPEKIIFSFWGAPGFARGTFYGANINFGSFQKIVINIQNKLVSPRLLQDVVVEKQTALGCRGPLDREL